MVVVRRCGLMTDRLAVVPAMAAVSARLVAHDCARSHRAAQRLIEPRSEEGLRRTDGVSRVDDDDVVLVALVLDELGRVGVHLSGSNQSGSERGCQWAVRVSVTARRSWLGPSPVVPSGPASPPPPLSNKWPFFTTIVFALRVEM